MTHAELLAIPAPDTATDPIRSTADLRQRWRALMGPLGFGERLLRFVFVGADRRFVKMLTDVEIGARPDPIQVGNLMSALAELVDGREPGTTVAFLLTRPGRGPITETDRDWASVVAAHAEEFGVPIEPFFRADDDTVVEVKPEGSAA